MQKEYLENVFRLINLKKKTKMRISKRETGCRIQVKRNKKTGHNQLKVFNKVNKQRGRQRKKISSSKYIYN